MRVVFVKHLDSAGEFIFSVPENITVYDRDTLIVDTRFGLALGIAISNTETISEAIAKRLGAHLPLKSVILVISRDLINIIEMAKEKKLISDMPF